MASGSRLLATGSARSISLHASRLNPLYFDISVVAVELDPLDAELPPWQSQVTALMSLISV